LISLGVLTQNEKTYTNVGVLLSDQVVHTIEVEESLNMSQTMAGRFLKKLVSKELIIKKVVVRILIILNYKCLRLTNHPCGVLMTAKNWGIEGN